MIWEWNGSGCTGIDLGMEGTGMSWMELVLRSRVLFFTYLFHFTPLVSLSFLSFFFMTLQCLVWSGRCPFFSLFSIEC